MKPLVVGLVTALGCGCGLGARNADGSRDAGRVVEDGGAGERVDSGMAVKGPARLPAPHYWIDGGLVTVRLVWNPGLYAHTVCRVMSTGRLFADTRIQGARDLVYVFMAEDAGLEIVPTPVLRITDQNESLVWYENDETRDVGVRCQRRLGDGGIEFAPKAFFDMSSWSASGYASGAVRNSTPGRWRGVAYPDGGFQIGVTDVIFDESGLGTGQMRDGGRRTAFLFDDGEFWLSWTLCG